MARRRRSYLWVGLIGLFALSIVGFYILLVPNNPITQMFRSSITDTKGRVVTGPYPVRSDFRELRDHGVTTIVSLLDPKIPYERALLQDERVSAQHFGMKFFNFPMASILGQKMGDYYQKDAELAAHTIDSLKNEKVYLHCYLGVHRMTFVRDILNREGTLTGTYTVRGAERTRDARILDSAFEAYHGANPKLAITLINRLHQPDVPALMIRGWSYYRLNDIPSAKMDFATALRIRPDMYDADNGLGYCMLRENKLDSADTRFQAVIAAGGENAQAEAGIAMARYREGKLNEARQHLSISLASDSTNEEAKQLLLRVNSGTQMRPAMLR